MASLKKTGTDFSSAKGMDPKAFFEVMGSSYEILSLDLIYLLTFGVGMKEVVDLDARAGGTAFNVV